MEELVNTFDASHQKNTGAGKTEQL